MNRFLQVDEDESTFGDPLDRAGKIVVQENHRGGFLGDVGPGDVHGNPQISFLEGRRIVDPIPRDAANMAHLLGSADNLELVFGRRAGKDDLVLPEDVVPLAIRQGVNLFPVDHNGTKLMFTNLGHGPTGALGYHGFGLAEHQIDLPTNGFGREGMIPRNHDDFDPSRPTLSNGFPHPMLRRILERDETDEDKIARGVVLGLLVENKILGVLIARQPQLGKAQDAMSSAGHVLVGFGVRVPVRVG